MAKVLVSGAGGYIGAPLCNSLLAAGHCVTAMDRFFFGTDRFGASNENPKFKIVKHDIRAISPTMLEGYEAVIDLAGLSNDASAEISTDLTRSINYEGGALMARAAKSAGVRRYVYASSASVYGQGVHEHLKETDECRPQTLYAESKLHVEGVLATLSSATFETVIFRNATVFGLAPRMRFDLAVNIMTLRAWKDHLIYIMGGGEQWRPFVHVNDVVRVMKMGLEEDANKVAGETFNVGGDRMNFQINQLAQFVRDVIPHAVIHNIPDDADKRTYNVAFTKIRNNLDYEPQIGIHEGVVEIKQALQNGRLKGDDPTCYTLSWYRSLIDWEKRVKELSINGSIF